MRKLRILLAVAVLPLLLLSTAFVTPVSADTLSGAIFTTLENGSRVNANIYEAKEDVYLDGGPGPNAPSTAAGLPEGDYYFQVTDPSGKVLLSQDPVKCRCFHVNEDGVISGVCLATVSKKVKGAMIKTECSHQTGVDIDHGALTVQLYPYSQTPNKGNVYKVWVTAVEDFLGNPENIDNPGQFHGFIPSQSKTDNFKVLRGKPFVPPFLEVKKFDDSNANGLWDSGEQEISGWQVEITDPFGVTNIYYTPVAVQAMPEGTWIVVEETPLDWLQTALYVDGVSQVVSATTRVEVSGISGEIHRVVYGNIQLGDITGCKWYDRNADGLKDSTEPFIPGWLIKLDGVAITDASVHLSGYTDDSGCVTFADLLPGNYTLSEVIPLTGNWISTTPTSYPISLAENGSEAREFGNFCFSYVNFDTKGYWHNKNGLAEITQGDIDYVNGLDPYNSDTEYWQSEPFDGVWEPLNPGNYFGSGAWAEISDYLVSPVSGSPARFQLAQQLLAFTFNSLHRLDSPEATIQLPDDNWMTASELISQASLIWSGATNAERVSMQEMLDSLNNSIVLFVCCSFCPVVYP